MMVILAGGGGPGGPDAQANAKQIKAASKTMMPAVLNNFFFIFTPFSSKNRIQLLIYIVGQKKQTLRSLKNLYSVFPVKEPEIRRILQIRRIL